MEAWEKVYVGYDFVADVHNIQNCIGCHGGVAGLEDMEGAHEGVVRDPLTDAEYDNSCRVCHTESGRLAETSLHRNLHGYYTVLEGRGADLDDPVMAEAFENHCDDCHTTCGQCHVSRPTELGGGLLKEHEVKRIAMKDTCLGCHGARVGDEYQGKNEGVEGSVHWVEGGMSCFECHEMSHYHGDGTEQAHRYDGEPGVKCLECHEEAGPEQSDIPEHTIHGEEVPCEVCHVSGPYKSCYNCHVSLNDAGEPILKTDPSQLTLKIGHNPIQSEDRPWDYVLLRHVPVARDTFAFYEDYELPEFDNAPTWKYATPHNIQRVTAQNESCESCHGNDDLFLTADDVVADELAANVSVIVEEIPEVPHPGLENYDIPQACVECHPKAEKRDWKLLNENIHSLDWEVEPAGEVIRCEDCHAEDGNFDWTVAGYSEEEVVDFIWDEYPDIEPAGALARGVSWIGLLGMGVAIAGIVAVPIVLRRRNHDLQGGTHYE